MLGPQSLPAECCPHSQRQTQGTASEEAGQAFTTILPSVGGCSLNLLLNNILVVPGSTPETRMGVLGLSERHRHTGVPGGGDTEQERQGNGYCRESLARIQCKILHQHQGNQDTCAHLLLGIG